MRVARGFDVLRLATAVPQTGRPSASRERLRREAIELTRHEALIDAAYSYCIVPLARRPAPADKFLHAGGETLPASWLIPESGELTAVACGVCTLGQRLEQRVSALFVQRHAALAMALDQLGNELLFTVSRRAQDRMQADATRRGLCLAGELRAGDPGLPLEAQGAVLRLAQSENVGVALGVVSHLEAGQTSYEVGCFTIMIGGAPVQRLTSVTGQNCMGVMPNGSGVCLVPSQVTLLTLG